jgi:hypothetical protein
MARLTPRHRSAGTVTPVGMACFYLFLCIVCLCFSCRHPNHRPIRQDTAVADNVSPLYDLRQWQEMYHAVVSDTVICPCQNGHIYFLHFTPQIVFDTIVIYRTVNGTTTMLEGVSTGNHEGDGHFFNPQLFRYGGHTFFSVRYRVDNTGNQNETTLFYIDTLDCSLHRVIIEKAADRYRQEKLKPDERIRKYEELYLANDEAIAEFYIWDAADANCCPTAGKVMATYQLEERSHRPFMLKVRQYNVDRNDTLVLRYRRIMQLTIKN